MRLVPDPTGAGRVLVIFADLLLSGDPRNLEVAGVLTTEDLLE